MYLFEKCAPWGGKRESRTPSLRARAIAADAAAVAQRLEPLLGVQLAQPGFIRDGTWGGSVRRIESEEPSTRRKSGHEPAAIGTTRHYVAQDQPLHVVVGGCALSSEGVCILGFRPDLHRVQGAVATWVKTGENSAAARRAGGKRGGMQGPCGCARGTPF